MSNYWYIIKYCIYSVIFHYTTFWVGKILTSADQVCIYLINWYSNIVQYLYNLN